MTNSIRRKLSIAAWSAPREGNIFGSLKLDVSQVMRYLEDLKERTGTKVTISHFVGKVIALGLRECPTLNGIITLDHFRPYKTIDMSFLVFLNGDKDLAKTKICEVDKKSVQELAAELQVKADKLRKGKDKEHSQSLKLIKIMPVFMIRWILKFTQFLTCTLGINAKSFGLEAYPFGTCCITNVGTFGLDHGFAPFTPFTRVPLLILLGSIKKEPFVIGDEVVVRPAINIAATIDHRYVDGYEISVLSRCVKKYFDDPWLLDHLDK